MSGYVKCFNIQHGGFDYLELNSAFRNMYNNKTRVIYIHCKNIYNGTILVIYQTGNKKCTLFDMLALLFNQYPIVAIFTVIG